MGTSRIAICLSNVDFPTPVEKINAAYNKARNKSPFRPIKP